MFGPFAAQLLENEPSPERLDYLQWRCLAGVSSSTDPPASEALQQLAAQITVPAMLQGLRIVETAMWIGRCRSSSIHFDAKDNIHCVLQGQKTFYLWDPWQIEQFEMLPLRDRGDLRPIAAPTAYSWSEISSPEDDEDRKGLACTRVTVHAGDAIYIPMGWFHEVVTSEQVTVSCNFWFEPGPRARFRPTSMFLSSSEYLEFCREVKKRKV